MNRQPFSIWSLLLPGSSEPAERNPTHLQIYKRFLKATLPSTSYDNIEDPRLHTMPARQASLEGYTRIVLLLFVLLFFKMRLTGASPR